MLYLNTTEILDKPTNNRIRDLRSLHLPALAHHTTANITATVLSELYITLLHYILLYCVFTI